MTQSWRYASGASLVVAFICVALSFRSGSLALGIAAAVAFVFAVVFGAAVLYFLIGLHNLGD